MIIAAGMVTATDPTAWMAARPGPIPLFPCRSHAAPILAALHVNHVGSPFQDRVYVTWTEFGADGTAYVYESYSADYGQTFSSPILVSSDSNLCPNTYGLPTPHGRCNENQDSDPFTGPDGSLYVAYTNYNNSTSGKNDNHNQFLLVKSTDGGKSFTGMHTNPRKLPSVTNSSSQATTDQFWQWEAFSQNGTLAVSYYDRQYGTDENNGFSDISLSASEDLQNFDATRVTSSSMPPPTELPDVNGASDFYGDYSGMTVVGNDAHPLWMDTRNRDLFICPKSGFPGKPPKLCTAVEPNGVQANDQDVFTATVDLPDLLHLH
jgi:hypothetical protein